MDIRQIQYFIRVFEERSFSRAAERANVVQPALSMQIRRLEDELGTQLFDRTPRGIEPTVAGDRLYQLCLPILHNLAHARQEVMELGSGAQIAGSLRVGLPPSVNRGILGEVLSDYIETYPEVEITVTEAYSNSLTEMVQQGSLDLALGGIANENTGLQYRPALADRLLLVCGQPINGPTLTPCRLSELKGLKLIVPPRPSFLGSTIHAQISNGSVDIARMMQIEGVIASIEMARASDWSVLFPFIAMRHDLRQGGMYLYPVIEPEMSFLLYFVHDPRRPLTGAARKFCEKLEIHLRRVDGERAAIFGPEPETDTVAPV